MSSVSNDDVERGTTPLSARSRSKTSFTTQANALLRKNVVYQVSQVIQHVWCCKYLSCFLSEYDQRRNFTTNCCLISMPIVLCLLLFAIQVAINGLLNGPDFKCGCKCIEFDSNRKCLKKDPNVCGVEYSKDSQVAYCEVANPTKWPAFQQVPKPEYRAVGTAPTNFAGLPPSSCRDSPSGCPISVIYTGENKTLADCKVSFDRLSIALTFLLILTLFCSFNELLLSESSRWIFFEINSQNRKYSSFSCCPHTCRSIS